MEKRVCDGNRQHRCTAPDAVRTRARVVRGYEHRPGKVGDGASSGPVGAVHAGALRARRTPDAVAPIPGFCGTQGAARRTGEASAFISEGIRSWAGNAGGPDAAV